MNDVPPRGRNPELTVIVPVSERYDDISVLHGEYARALADSVPTIEYVYVLDGPFPEVRSALESLQADGEPVTIVQLASGTGEATAIMVGAEETRSDKLLILPAWFQVEPASLPAILSAFDRQHVLIGRRWPRRDSTLNRLATRVFGFLLRMVTLQRFDDVGCGVRLLRREVLEEIALYGDQHRFLPILASQRGFRVEEFDLPQDARDRRYRVYRPGVYLRRLLDLIAVFFVVRFTKKPLRFFGLIGTALIVLGVLVLAVMAIQRMLFGMGMAERPLLLFGALCVVLGFQLFAVGLIGELIIFTHARELKEYSIAERVNFDRDRKRTPP